MTQQRLPTPGGDDGQWGDILNGFLGVAHDQYGNLLPAAVSAALPSPIPTANLGSGTASGSTYLRGDGTWATPASGVTLDSTAGDIQPLGVQAAGSSALAAKADHVHAMPRLDQAGAPTANVSLNAHKLTGIANGTVATDAAAYGQLPAYPNASIAATVQRAQWLDVRDYGVVVGSSSAQDTAIHAACVASAAVAVPLYWPYSSTGYHISTMLDTSATGLNLSFTYWIGAAANTGTAAGVNLIQDTANTSCVRLGGSYVNVSGLTFTAPNGSTNAAMELGNVGIQSAFTNITLEGGAYGINLPQVSFNGNGNWGAFSAVFENFHIQGPTIGFINWRAYQAASTGNVWRNIYCQADGQTSPTGTKVYFSGCTEITIQQLNIEGVTFNQYGGLICFTQCSGVSISALHFERITAPVNGQWQAFVYNYGDSNVQIDAMTVQFSTLVGGTIYMSRGDNANAYTTIRNLYVDISNTTVTTSATFNSTLNNGTSYTALPVAALSSGISQYTPLYVKGASTYYALTTSSAVSSGATSIPVFAFTPTENLGSGTIVGSVPYSLWVLNPGSTTSTTGGFTIDTLQAGVANGEFIAGLNDSDATSDKTRTAMRRIGSHVMSEIRYNGTYLGYTSTTAPTSGTWVVGDEVRVLNPVIAGSGGSQYMIIGYRCTTAGAPGTWTPERVLTGS